MMYQCNTSWQMPYLSDDALLNNIIAAGKNFFWTRRCKFYSIFLILRVKNEEEEMLTGWESKFTHTEL